MCNVAEEVARKADLKPEAGITRGAELEGSPVGATRNADEQEHER